VAEAAAENGYWLVVGVGNPARGDDALGRIAARRLRARAPRNVEVREHDGEATALLERLAGADAVCLVDAAFSGAPPGTIKRFDATEAELPKAVFSVSTHGLGLTEAIALARALGQLPRRCVVYAIEGRSFESGAPLSAEADKAVDEVVERILRETRQPAISGG
jgi:hydrogenase maturation protease